MTWGLLLILAAVTYGSRVLGLVSTPEVTGRLRDVLEALPAPLFAALAVASLTGPGGLGHPSLLGAFAGALLAVLARQSLMAALGGGVLGFLAGLALTAA